MRTLFLLLFLPLVAFAHPLSTVQVDAILSDAQPLQLEASFKTKEIFLDQWPDKEGVAAQIKLPENTEERYRSFVAQYVAASELSFDGVKQRPELASVSVEDVPDETGLTAPVNSLVLRFSVRVPEGAKRFTWSNQMPLGAYVFVVKGGEAPLTHWLITGQESQAISLSGENQGQSATEIILLYLWLGFTHILPLGIDHVLFVLGIFFLCTSLRPMIWQVSAFTLAHTITLALTIYGVVSLPSSIVEPIIAASIAYVGIENIVRRELKKSRILLVFVFGLLHGMGFAGVLSEIGLPQDALLTSLISFNVGVELGQLAVIVGAFVLVGVWSMHKEWYRSRVVIPASAMIALMGIYWAIERTFF